jgi:hypothetical protein
VDADIKRQFAKKLVIFILIKMAISYFIYTSAKYARKHAN